MSYIYISGGYLVADDETRIYQFPLSRCEYEENEQSLTVRHFTKQQRNQVVIPIADVHLWDKDAIGTKWADVEELRLFLQTFTARDLSPERFRYEERLDVFSALISNAWHAVVLPGAPANRIVEIVAVSSLNNQTTGWRKVGSSLDRSGQLDADSVVTMSVLTDEDGQIEVFAENIDVVHFFVSAYY